MASNLNNELGQSKHEVQKPFPFRTNCTYFYMSAYSSSRDSNACHMHCNKLKFDLLEDELHKQRTWIDITARSGT